MTLLRNALLTLSIAVGLLILIIYAEVETLFLKNLWELEQKQIQLGKVYFLLFLVCLIAIIMAFYIFYILERPVLFPSIEEEALLSTIPAWVYYKDKDLKYITGNRLFLKALNMTQEELRGKTDFDLFPEKEAKAFTKEDIEILEARQSKLNMYQKVTLHSGEKIWISKSASPYYDENHVVKGIVGIIIDISEHKAVEKQLHYVSYYDTLTNLPNRVLLYKQLQDSILQSKKECQSMALLYLNVDRFQRINDTLGYKAGDQFLRCLSFQLKKNARIGDIVYRVGEDKFIIVLSEIKTKEEIIKVSNKMIQILEHPWSFLQHKFYMTISMGISVYPKDGRDEDTLIKHAEIAAYHAKEQGRSRYMFYNSSLSARAFEELSLENNLRAALAKQEFMLYYQPQVDLRTGKIIGVEALLRWKHPKLGMVAPSKFIPFAEQSGLIIPIGEWVLRTACMENKTWNRKGFPKVRMAVNLSAIQFQQGNMMEVVSEILQKTEIEPSYLELEITESILMKDPEGALKLLHQLKDIGIRISLDDFGTGYSSLNYLKKFPIDKIKIDQSFIRDVAKEEEDRVIVKTIIGLSKNMGLRVIAEGVETKEQLRFLKTQECDAVQGYLISKPLSSEEIEEVFEGGEYIYKDKVDI